MGKQQRIDYFEQGTLNRTIDSNDRLIVLYSALIYNFLGKRDCTYSMLTKGIAALWDKGKGESGRGGK